MSEVPSSLEELKVGFGISIATLGFQVFYNVDDAMRMAIEQTDPRKHIQAAERIRTSDPETFQAFGRIADRMLDYLPGNRDFAIISLMNDMEKNLYRIYDLLGRNTHPYFTEIFQRAPLEKDPEKMKTCFEAVVAFGRGE